MSGIYIHIPFCRQACSYCDFYFVTGKTDPAPFVKALGEEIRSCGDTVYSEEPVNTIYFGGGTPSRLNPGMIGAILEILYSTFDCRSVGEITMEMNPDDVTSDYLRNLIDLGITRASMGVQTFNADLLRFMHRAHTAEEARQCMDILSGSEFPTYSVDLIYGNPGQEPEDLQHDLDILGSYHPPHVSAYALTIEPRTRLGKQLALNRLVPVTDDEAGNQMDLIREELMKRDIVQYEVSNFAQPGHQSRHNSAYWRHTNYLGFGPAAHSFWWDKNGHTAYRWQNEAHLQRYIANPAVLQTNREELLPVTLAEERIMISMRTIAGIDAKELEKRYGYFISDEQKQYLKKLEGKNLIKKTDSGVYRPTPDGLKVADHITLDLITRHDGVVSRES